MNSPTAVYLDTNVIIALTEGPRTDEYGLNAFASSAWRNGDIYFQTSELSFAELLVVPYRNKDRALIDQYIRLFGDKQKLTVVPVERPILDIAAVLRASPGRLRLPDAIHLATACAGNCAYFLTLDRDFKDLAQTPHPFFPDLTLPPVKIIHPDSSSLSELSKALAP